METKLTSKSGAQAFDFFFGSWKVHNRRLLKRLEANDEWEEFDADSACHPVLGGVGNVEEFKSAHRPDFVGMSLRLYEPQSGQWSIYWVDNQSVILQPPVVGRFSESQGIFEGVDEFASKPILVRFIWSCIDTDQPHWEQAFSADQGKTWETNWTMDFYRTTSLSDTKSNDANDRGGRHE